LPEVPSSVGTDRGRVLTGLAGRGILESRSPWLHEAEGKAQGLELAYSLHDFTDRGWQDDELPHLLDTLQSEGYAGINVTFPFKQAIIPYLDDLSEGARQIGAVNTVSFADGKRTGFNTDVTGFATSFRNGLSGVATDCVLQLGCGGAGSATAHALLSDVGVGVLTLFDTDAAKLTDLKTQLTARYGADRVDTSSDPVQAAARADGLVNATPVGMAKYPGLPIAVNAIEARHWIAEIVYFPLETEFLREARRKGCQTLDGSGMAVHQAAEAFEIFTGANANRARMLASFKAFVAGVTVKAA
jgi:shikimate dehydrogenase